MNVTLHQFPQMKLNNRRLRAIGVWFLMFAFCAIGKVAFAGGWPTYKANCKRNAVTAEAIEQPLFLQWTYLPAHSPKPAWPMPSEELPRMHCDNAFHVAVADGCVYFGSSVTDEVYCLDIDDGMINWTFSAQGPVRFAPVVYNGCVYFGCDDGFVYCLEAGDGRLVWKYRPGPSGEKVIGNGRLISLWPVRTGVLVDDGVVYLAAGVFPYEGIYICALKADDGSVVWKNDTIGDHPHDLEYGGISPHGYILASEDVIYVPSGRAMPAAFNRKTGEFIFYASPGHKRGGTWALLDNDELIAGVAFQSTPCKIAYDASTGKRKSDVFGWFPGIDMVCSGDSSYVLSRNGIYAVSRKAYSRALKKTGELAKKRKKSQTELSQLKKNIKTADANSIETINEQINQIASEIADFGKEEKELKKSSYKWHYSGEKLSSLILAGETLFAGGEGVVVGINAKTGKQIYKADVSGRAVGMAVADGCLFVSSDKGPIYCFSKKEISQPVDIKTAVNNSPYPEDKNSGVYKSAAEEIVKQTAVNKGYCLVLDCGLGQLAFELAKRTELKIVGIEKDEGKLAAARKNLKAAGLLGDRVVVEPWDLSELPDYFANLIVSDGMLVSGGTTASQKERDRLLRPYGGVSLLGHKRFWSNKISWDKSVRGKLPGAGSWTQQYCDPQNTACSGDELVNGPLGILWFGQPGPQGMVERHAEAQSPVSINGRMFVQGEEMITAVDAFNGTILWKRQIPGAVRIRIKADSGNLVVTEDGLYIAAGDKCYRLDPATGKTMRTYNLPPSSDEKPRRWGYISVEGDILYGSTATAMLYEYGVLWKTFTENGKWKKIDGVPQRHKKMYERYKKQYPDANDLRMFFQRSAHMFYGVRPEFHYTETCVGGTAFVPSAATAGSGEFVQRAVSRYVITGDKIFAMDTETGKLLWVHNGDGIANITVALGDGKIFFAEKTTTEKHRKSALEDRRKLIKAGIYKIREGILDELKEKEKQLAEYPDSGSAFQKKVLVYLIDSLKAEMFKEEFDEGTLSYNDADVRIVIALDAVTGRKIWEKPVDLTGCCSNKMGAAYSDGLLLFFGNWGNHDGWRDRVGGLKWRRITALSAENGNMAWSRALGYRTRPVIVGDTIILEPRACKLRTGETIMRKHPVTGKSVDWEFLRPGHTCGLTTASAGGLFYRSACTAFYDLEKDRGVTIFGGYRPGCAISLIPAGGLLLSPEAASGCTCSYPIRCSMALKRKPQRSQPWTIYVTDGDIKPVSHLAVNFGAPADRKDDEATVWFAYPNPDTKRYTHYPNYGVKIKLNDQILPEMGYFCRDFKGINIADTDKPWLFTSGCRGLLRCEVPLTDDDNRQKSAVYTVRLGFNAPPKDRLGQRVFDIKLQGRIVLENFDALKAAGKGNKAVVREFKNISAKNTLVLELSPQPKNPDINHAPIINFIEIIKQDKG